MGNKISIPTEREQQMNKIDLEINKQLVQYKLEPREKEVCEKQIKDEKEHYTMMRKQCHDEYNDWKIREDVAWRVYNIMRETRPSNHSHIKESKKKYDTIAYEHNKLYEKCRYYGMRNYYTV